MLWKFLVVASLAVGVFGRSTVDGPGPDNAPFDEYSTLVIKEYCNATHAEDKASEVKSAMITFDKCLNAVIDFETFAKEMEKAEKSGVYDEVIQKYCPTAPQIKECVGELVHGVSPCLPAGLERTAVKNANALIDFACDNNGARMTSYFKEDGPRCIRDKMFYIAYCQDAITANFTRYTNSSGDGISAIASSLYTISDKDWCVLVDQSLECLVNVVKSCPKPAIGKLGQEFHNIYLESLSCPEVTQHATTELVAGTEGTVETNTTGSSDSGIFGSFTFSIPDNSPYGKYIQRVATEFCNAAHAEDKTSEVKSAMITFAKCLNGVTNIEMFLYEIEKAMKSGVYDKVIQKFCSKVPQIKECASDLVKGMAPCLPAGFDRTAVKSTNTLMDFVCDNNGARITTFVQAGGPRCISDTMVNISYCEYVYGKPSSLFTKSEKDRCVLVDQSLECLVTAIKSCPNPTIGQLAQEFHNVFLESLSCSEVTQHASTEVVAGTEGTVDTTTGRTDEADGGKDIDQLKKRKLELEVRTAELEIWKRENDLNVQHTVLTSDIKMKGH